MVCLLDLISWMSGVHMTVNHALRMCISGRIARRLCDGRVMGGVCVKCGIYDTTAAQSAGALSSGGSRAG